MRRGGAHREGRGRFYSWNVYFLCKIGHNSGWMIHCSWGANYSGKGCIFRALTPFTNSPCCVVNTHGPEGRGKFVLGYQLTKEKLLCTNQFIIFTTARGLRRRCSDAGLGWEWGGLLLGISGVMWSNGVWILTWCHFVTVQRYWCLPFLAQQHLWGFSRV